MENGCLNGVANGNNSSSAAGLTERGLETVRLIGQFLRELGLSHSAEVLIRESGCALENGAAASFRCHVANGDWDAAEECMNSLQELACDPESAAAEIAFLMFEQRYMELLESGDYMGALNVLRNRLTPLKFNTGRVHELSTYIMCSDADELRRISGWPGSRAGTREMLLDKLQRFFPPAVMLPPRRLMSLLDEAVQYQLARCRYHNAVLPGSSGVSLLQDHACSRESAEFPAACGQVLEQHEDEVKQCQFSPDGCYLATGCKDGSVLVWLVDELTLGLTPHRRYHIGDDRGGVSCLAWSPDGTKLLCCAAEDSAEVLLWRPTLPRPLSSLSSSADRRQARANNNSTNSASSVVDIGVEDDDDDHDLDGAIDDELSVAAAADSAGAAQQQHQHQAQRFSRANNAGGGGGGHPTDEALTTAAWFPDSRHFVAGGARGQFYLFSCDAGFRKSWDFIRVVAMAARVDADGNTAVLAADTFGRVRQYRFDTMQDETLIKEDSAIVGMCLSPDQRCAALSVANSGMHLWDLVHRVRLRRLMTGPAPAAAAATGQSGAVAMCVHACFGGLGGDFVAAGAQDHCAYVWHRWGRGSDDGKESPVPDRLSGHAGTVNCVAWNPRHQSMLVTASDDCTLRVWLPTARAVPAAAAAAAPDDASSAAAAVATSASSPSVESNGGDHDGASGLE